MKKEFMSKSNDVDVNDIYMLTNKDKDSLPREDAKDYLMNTIDKSSKKFAKLFGPTLYKEYISNIYNNLTDKKKDIVSRQQIYDAVVSGKMIGGAV